MCANVAGFSVVNAWFAFSRHNNAFQARLES
jgi:hypothetical protein